MNYKISSIVLVSVSSGFLGMTSPATADCNASGTCCSDGMLRGLCVAVPKECNGSGTCCSSDGCWTSGDRAPTQTTVLQGKNLTLRLKPVDNVQIYALQFSALNQPLPLETVWILATAANLEQPLVLSDYVEPGAYELRVEAMNDTYEVLGVHQYQIILEPSPVNASSPRG